MSKLNFDFSFQPSSLGLQDCPRISKFAKMNSFVDTLAENSKLKGIFATDLKLVPADITKTLGLKKQKSDSFNFDKLEKDAIAANEEIRNQKEYLDRLPNLSLSGTESLHDQQDKTTTLTLTAFCQVLQSFNACFDSTLQPWCKSVSNEPFLQFGDICSKLGPDLEIVTLQLFKTISDLRKNDRILQATKNKVDDKPDFDIKLETIHDTLDILQETIDRLSSISDSPIMKFQSISL